MSDHQHVARSLSIDLMDQLQRRWNAVILSGKPNGLAEKPDLLASLNQVGEEFGHLRSELVDALGDALRHEASIDLGTRAQIAVDILIRNLFERTADVGFLAEDRTIIDSLLQDGTAVALQPRLRAYVDKYSVYDDIAVYRTDGALHATLLGEVSPFAPLDALVGDALAAPGSFHEIFREDGVLPPRLLYVQAIRSAEGSRAPQTIGVLALSFRFADEMTGIFADLLAGASDDLVLGILDRHQRLIASSHSDLVPTGHILQLAEGRLQELAIGNQTWRGLRLPNRGYQGFHGLDWSGIALQPLHRRREDKAVRRSDLAGDTIDEQEIEREIAGSTVVSPGLRRISGRAYAIDTDLHLIGLNGKIAADRENNRVLPAVLASIREVGESIRNAVYNVVGDLYRQSQRHLRHKVAQMAALGVNILDRNLYERANDCRWWALTPRFRQILAAHDGDGAALDADETAEIGRTLAYINGLYTVYSNLLVFDRQRRVIAESRPSGMTGQRLDGTHIAAALQNLDPQRYSVSAFETTPLYADRPTYVYCGSILSPDGQNVVGGIAVVFDSEPQFKQMLSDVMPLREDGTAYADSVAAFINEAGLVISSTDPREPPGSVARRDTTGNRGIHHEAASPGYREFKRIDGYVDRLRCRIAIST